MVKIQRPPVAAGSFVLSPPLQLRICSKLQHLTQHIFLRTYKLDMQTDLIKQYSGMVPLARKNANHNNWKWNRRPTVWKLAEKHWQEFCDQWYGCEDDDPLLPGFSLSLQPPASDRPRSLLVRECYVEIFRRIWARAFSSEGLIGAVITGQPGTGKSLLAYDFLVSLLKRKQIVLFSDDGISVYLFYCGKVYTSTSARLQASGLSQLPIPSAPNVFIWSIFDIAEMQEPARFFVKYPCLPVQTASPDPVRYKIWSKNRHTLLVGIPLWTRAELVLGLEHQPRYSDLMVALGKYIEYNSPLDLFRGTGTLLDQRDEDEDDAEPWTANDALNYILDESIARFGHSARDVYDGVFNYEETTRRHEATFSISYDGLREAVNALSGNNSPPLPLSYKILAVSPTQLDAFTSDCWQVDFKSDWVFRSLIKRLGQMEDSQIREWIRHLHHIPDGRQLAGRFLEPFAHRAIQTETNGDFWPLRNMTWTHGDVNSPTFTTESSAPSDPNLCEFLKIKRESVTFFSDDSEVLKYNRYYIPDDPNFPLFDAFTVELDPSKKSAVLWILQMTTSRLHLGSAKGYEAIRSIIANLKTMLEDSDEEQPPKRKTRAKSAVVHVRYLLVVPKGLRGSRKWAFPPGWNEKRKRNDHRGNVYCLELPLGVEEIARE